MILTHDCAIRKLHTASIKFCSDSQQFKHAETRKIVQLVFDDFI